MKKAKYVAVEERYGRIGLKKVGDRLVKLEEVCGKIVSSETRTTGYGSCLNLRLKGCKEDVWWQEQSKMPMPAFVGQTLRGFYDGKSNEGKVICLDAYELFDGKMRLLTRATKSRIYEFVS